MSNPKEKSLLTPKEIDECISAFLLTASNNPDIRFALVGGVALQAFGYPEGTKDVDFIVTDLPKELYPLEEGLPLDIGGSSYFVNKTIEVDLIVRRDGYKTLYEEALDHAVDQAGLPIITLEYLAALKYLAGRPKDLNAVRWILSGPGRVNSVWIGMLLEQHLGQYARESWTRFSMPYRKEHPREEYT
jgi:hypothetical protein